MSTLFILFLNLLNANPKWIRRHWPQNKTQTKFSSLVYRYTGIRNLLVCCGLFIRLLLHYANFGMPHSRTESSNALQLSQSISSRFYLNDVTSNCFLVNTWSQPALQYFSEFTYTCVDLDDCWFTALDNSFFFLIKVSVKDKWHLFTLLKSCYLECYQSMQIRARLFVEAFVVFDLTFSVWYAQSYFLIWNRTLIATDFYINISL